MNAADKSWIHQVSWGSLAVAAFGAIVGATSVYLYTIANAEARLNVIEKSLEEALIRNGEVQRGSSDILSKMGFLDAKVRSLEEALKTVDVSKLEAITEVLEDPEEESGVVDILARVIDLENQLNVAGQLRSGEDFAVTNPRMGAQKAVCPPGTFVSAVSAPGGIGGRYGIDGISLIQVTCSPLFKE